MNRWPLVEKSRSRPGLDTLFVNVMKVIGGRTRQSVADRPNAVREAKQIPPSPSSF